MNMDAILNIKANVDGVNNIVALNRGLQAVEGTAKGVTGAIRGLSGASAGLTGALGALAPLASVAGLVGLAKGALDAGDKLNDLSQSTGVSVEALSRFKKAAAVSGTDIDTVAKSLVKLSRGLVETATTGKGKAAEALKSLGISATDASGKLKNADKVTLEIANKFKSLPDGAAKSALAVNLFGRAGAELIPLLNLGGDAIDKLSVKLTTAFAQKADAYSDKLAVLSGKVGALGADLLIALLPALDAVTDAVTAGVTAFNSLPDAIKGLAVGGAILAIAWGPITGIVSGANLAFLAGKAAIEGLRVQLALAALEEIPAISAAILAIPGWGWALAGVTALAALSTALYLNNKDFKNWVDNVVVIVQNDFSNAMSQIATDSKTAFEAVKGALGSIKSVGVQAASSLSSAFGGAFGQIAQRAKQAFASFGQTIAAWWNSLPAPIRNLISGTGGAVANAVKMFPGVYSTVVAFQALGKGPVKKAKGKGNGDGNEDGGGDLPGLTGGGGGKSSNGAKEKNEADRKRLELDAARNALEAAYVKDVKQINDLKRIENQFQANGNTLKALEVQKSEAILEGKLTEKKVTDELLLKLKESAADKDQANRKLKDQNLIQSAANKLADEEEKLRSRLLDIDQQITEERKKQGREQQKALADIRNRTKYAVIGAIQGSEAESRQREIDDFKRRIKDAKERGNVDEARRLQEQLDLLIAQFKELDRLANNAAFGIAKGIRGYLEGVGSLADSVASVTKNVFQGLEDKLVEFVTTGKASFKDFANEIIKQLIRIAIQQAILKPLLQGFGSLFGGLAGGAAAAAPSPAGTVFAANGMIAANGIQPFAMGGVVTRPTLFKFANGGTMRNGLMGEAGPEAIIPLKRAADGKLGVAGGGSSTTINVSVDAKGSSVQGDSGKSNELGRVVAAAVQQELIKQKRPGGILAS